MTSSEQEPIAQAIDPETNEVVANLMNESVVREFRASAAWRVEDVE